MATTNPTTEPLTQNTYSSGSESDARAPGGRKAKTALSRPGAEHLPTPQNTHNLSQPAGQLLKGATHEDGKQKDAALLVGIKLDLEAEIHLTARVRGDICVGLY